MEKNNRVEDTSEAWESGQLGAEPNFVKRAEPVRQKEVDEVLGLQSISIRLPKDLIEQFKLIAAINGVGYQPLMRDALKRFAESEIKVILTQMAEKKGKQKESKASGDCPPSGAHRKAA